MVAKKTAAKKLPSPPPTVLMKTAAKRRPAKKTASKTPPPSVEKPGLKMPDAGLHIAVLGALLDAGLVSASSIEKKLRGIEPIDDEDDDLERETKQLLIAMGRMHAITLDPKKLAKIENVDFDGGNEIYMMLEDGAGVETGGEDDTYCLQSLKGIEALTKMRRLSLDGHGYRAKTLSLRPLKNHPALETLILTGKCSHVKTLESLPKLAIVKMTYAEVDDPAVIDRLAERGVKIER